MSLVLCQIIILWLVLSSQSIAAQEIMVYDETGTVWNLPDSLKHTTPHDSVTGTQRIIDWFRGEGFMEARIDSANGKVFYVKPGPKYRLRLTIKGKDIREEQISDEFSAHVLEEHLHQKLVHLQDEGRYMAQVKLIGLEMDSLRKEVHIQAQIEQAEPVFSAGMVFQGNRINSSEYLEKISGYQDSSLITPYYLQELARRLDASELLEHIAPPEFVLVDGKPHILMVVEEGSLNFFDGVLGVVPDSRGKAQLVGDLGVSLWNVLGQGNGVELAYERLKPETSRLELGMNQHWIADLPIGLGASFHFYQNDSTYQLREVYVDGVYDMGNGLRLTGGLTRSATSVSGNSVQIIEPGGKLTLARFGFRYSTLGGGEVPKKGIFLEASFGTGNKSVEIDTLSAFSFQKAEVAAKGVVPLTQKTVMALRLFGETALSDGFTDSDLSRLGGATSLRGYSEEQFRASQFLWGDAEYRFLTNPTSYMFVFAAAGIYHRPKLLSEPNEQFRTTKFLYSAGFGLSYQIKVGRLTFSYAISPQESVGNGKVHVGIKTRL